MNDPLVTGREPGVSKFALDGASRNENTPEAPLDVSEVSVIVPLPLVMSATQLGCATLLTTGISRALLPADSWGSPVLRSAPGILKEPPPAATTANDRM